MRQNLKSQPRIPAASDTRISFSAENTHATHLTPVRGASKQYAVTVPHTNIKMIQLMPLIPHAGARTPPIAIPYPKYPPK
jgi:hypothetical protein